MATDPQTLKNTDDIHSLALTVTKLVAVVESGEKRHDSDMDVIRQAVQGINDLNARMGATIGMEKDIASLRDLMSEKNGDLRTIRHDLNNVLNAMTAIPVVNEKVNLNAVNLAAHDARINAIESWKDKIEGGTAVIKSGGKWFWAIFGGIITTVLGGVLALVFNERARSVISGE